MDYETNLDLCEYNPISIQFEQELRQLETAVKNPSACFFQRMIKKIILSHAVEA